MSDRPRTHTRICTWLSCSSLAHYPQLDSSGRRWSDLCPAHHDDLRTALAAGTDLRRPLEIRERGLRLLLQCWVRASGGASTLSSDLSSIVGSCGALSTALVLHLPQMRTRPAKRRHYVDRRVG